jgi:hypothetical protein
MNIFIVLGVLILMPLTVCKANQKLYDGKLKQVSISAISALFVYFLLIVNVIYIEHKLDSELAAFDLNGDGIFSGGEITPEQEKAMHRVVADTGRTFAPITGAIFSVVYFFGLWLLFSIVSWVGKWRAG